MAIRLTQFLIRANFSSKVTSCDAVSECLMVNEFLQRAQCPHCKGCISYNNSVRPSVCPSVGQTPVLCQNDGT